MTKDEIKNTENEIQEGVIAPTVSFGVDENTIKTTDIVADVVPTPSEAVPAEAPKAVAPKDTKDQKNYEKNPRRSRRGGPRREEKVKSEFDHRLVGIRRVSRTVAGGRRFSFSALVVVGNRKGKVGVGQGKSGDTPIAIEKAVRDAKKRLITVELTKEGRIPHEVQAKYSSAIVKIMPAKGRGILAGSATRYVLELAGVKEVNAKILSGSKNALNISKATIKALQMLTGAEKVNKK